MRDMAGYVWRWPQGNPTCTGIIRKWYKLLGLKKIILNIQAFKSWSHTAYIISISMHELTKYVYIKSSELGLPKYMSEINVKSRHYNKALYVIYQFATILFVSHMTLHVFSSL